MWFLLLIGWMFLASSWQVKTLGLPTLAAKVDYIDGRILSTSETTKCSLLRSATMSGVAVTTSLACFLSEVSANDSGGTKSLKKKKAKVLETDLGIKYIVLKQGVGSFPNPGDFVVIRYTAFLNNGTIFDSTEGKGRKPITFRMGKQQVIPGLESVVEYMQPGAEVTCTIPAKFAYGERGVCVPNEGCLVPRNEDLKYAVKLISIGAGYN